MVLKVMGCVKTPIETHDTIYFSHLRAKRMMDIISKLFLLKIKDDIEFFVKSCVACQLDKTERRKEAGLLQPIPIEEFPRDSIFMDLISGFPKVDDKALITVMIDWFLKYTILIDAPALCSLDKASKLFYKLVVKIFGVALDIKSDQDSLFTGLF